VTTQRIFTHQLASGLTLIAEEMDWLESAAFALLVPAGAALEAAGQGGLGHLTCEMIERGAGERDSRQIIADLENLGADCSSSCSNTHTSFGGAMPAESLPAVLSIYGDIIQRPHLPADQLEDARLGCLQDVYALEDDLSQKLLLELRQRFYADPHGRSALGTIESLTTLSHDDVGRFFRSHYQPRQAILSVAGKIDWPRLKEHVEQVFGDWRPGILPLAKESPPPRGYQHLAVESSQTHIGIGYEGLAYGDGDYFQLRGAIGVLADGMSSRLFSEVREKRGLAYTVFAMCHTLKDRGGVFAYAGTTAERAQETLDVLSAELRKLPEGITAEELARLKGKIKRSLILQQESSPSRSGSMAFDWYFLGRVRPMAELSKIIDDLSVASINGWLKKHPPGEFTVVTLGKDPLEMGR
jgi:predicted Zn-dependent peptidase